VTRVHVGEQVAVNPSLPCDACRFCLEGRQQHCLNMRFFGSAMRMPHVQGAFREVLVCPERQIVPFPKDLPFSAAAFAEPLSVALHAVNQAGALNGRRVLVTGAGPIGALCVLAARWAGAREVVATDIIDAPLKAVKKAGADLVFNVRDAPESLDRFATDNGWFDVGFECSGNGAALASALRVCRPGATIVQVGIAGGEVAVPLNMLVAKEISVRGTFRFHAEFALAVETIASGAIDVVPLLTATVPFADARTAFDLAADRTKSMKVQLAF
jgi:L-idonate 5-dehydrogenase